MVNSYHPRLFYKLLSVLVLTFSILSPSKYLSAEECCEEDHPDCEEHSLFNRKVLLVAVPLAAGAIAVTLATSHQHHMSYYTDSSYLSYYGYDERKYASSEHQHHHDHHHHSSSTHRSKATIAPIVNVEKIEGSVTLNIHVKGKNDQVLHTHSITISEPGTIQLDPIETEIDQEAYLVNLSYTLDCHSFIKGSLTTTLHSNDKESFLTTPFESTPNKPWSEISQLF